MKKLSVSMIAVWLLVALASGCAKTPEGIPTGLLDDKDAAMAIVFYRDYLASATIATLRYLHEGKPDDAIRIQEFIMDEVVAEVGSDVGKFSSGQRKIVAGMLAKIQEYRSKHPRSESRWYLDLPPEQKENYAKIDALLDEFVTKAKAQLPDGAFAAQRQIEPILLLRSYMVDNAIAALPAIRAGKHAALTRRMNDILDQLVLVCGPQMEKLSYDGRERAAEMFAKIKHYRDKYTREGVPRTAADKTDRRDEVSEMLDKITAKYEPHGMQPFFGVE